jgi:hypothetical protein
MTHRSMRRLTGPAILLVLIGHHQAVAQKVTQGDEVRVPLVEQLISADLLMMPTSEWVSVVIEPVLATTRFSKRWSINRTAKHGYLNFYFLRPGFAEQQTLPPIVRLYRDRLIANCAAIGIEDAVICDTDFLRSFAFDHGLLPTDPASKHELGFEGSLSRRLDVVQLWILGHEIGHVLNRDGPAHFSQGNVLAGPAQNQGTFETIRRTRDREYLADLFIANHFKHRNPEEAAMVSMLLDLANIEIVARHGTPASYGSGLAVDYASKTGNIVYYFDNDLHSHPEFLVRAIRLLQQIADSSHDSALSGMLSAFSYKFRQADAPTPRSP